MIERYEERHRLTGCAFRLRISGKRAGRRPGTFGIVVGQEQADGAKTREWVCRVLGFGDANQVRSVTRRIVTVLLGGAHSHTGLWFASNSGMVVKRVNGDGQKY